MMACEARCGHCFARCSGEHSHGDHGVVPDGHWLSIPELTPAERGAVTEQIKRVTSKNYAVVVNGDDVSKGDLRK
jgi:hypothetical protein